MSDTTSLHPRGSLNVHRIARAALLTVAVCLAACGRGTDEAAAALESTPAPEGAPAAETPAPTPPEPTSAEQAPPPDAVGLRRMANAEATRPRTVSPVMFERLVALMPDVEGWTRSEPRGEQHSTPVPYATATAVYRRDDQRVELELVDSGFQSLLLTPHEMFVVPGFNERSADGETRARTLGGAPAYERWSESRRRGEVVAIVARRFVVRTTGVGVPNLDPVNGIAGRVDLGALGGLR